MRLGGCFCVNAVSADKKGEGLANFLQFEEKATLSGPWDVQFDPRWGGLAKTTFNTLSSWTEHPDEGIKFYSGTAVYSKLFDADAKLVSSGQVFLDLGEVKDIGIAKVTLNGKDLGILWAPPLRVSVAGLLKAKNNQLQVEVTNTWRNRLVGDRGKPQNERFTKTNVRIVDKWEVLPSGLLGPVKLVEGR